jgi:drug/metabolite transporter (DMT)-like permease
MIGPKAKPNHLLPMLAAAATGVQVGSSIVATRFVIDQTDPVTLAFLRYLIGFCCLLIPAWRSASGWFDRYDLLPIALLGITQFGILIVLMNYGVQFIPSARAALIFACMPLLTMTLAALIGYERMRPYSKRWVSCSPLSVWDLHWVRRCFSQPKRPTNGSVSLPY